VLERLDHHRQRPDRRLQVGQRGGQVPAGQPFAAQQLTFLLVDHPAALGEHQEIGIPDVAADQTRQAGAAAGRSHDADAGGADSAEDLVGVVRHGVVAADEGAVEVRGDQLGESRPHHLYLRG
jgi:hypothetical protein